jgi:hypothetical protein
MRQRDIVVALLILLVLLVLLRRSKLVEIVESRFYPGAPGEKPSWQGKIGDVVEWGGKTWAWTEWPWAPGQGDWVEVAS